ncbi:diguanylate cyclase/phosphodiesterase [Caldicellulosiruptor kronotskyensis 2002]|uniref:Diguanylate cyclase/phosphodiesterase n=1 Tax=Caldicellulosiruptor kronotskyensis (strain DSM 18902 / VKM B-2412 / 2002) TaxID=632348 RepID=E4SE21_CALK2|nr:bifunctional diguanylate cyclase/phosphodiesterase [Caldicellulosiruptor kronotskyensis]ADQ45308.1 diguanylate cyclase/phosphodiesterase [Caldicellulosiruptor kronotskyensis 2002]
MSESSNDFWINNFKNIIEGNYERLVQLIKSERGFWLYDIEKKGVYISNGFEYISIQINGSVNFIQDVMTESEFKHLKKLVRDSIEKGQNGFSSRIKLKDGRWIFVCATILYSEQEPLKIVGTFEDVTPHVSCDLRLSRYIELIAYYDEITGLPNRNFLNEVLREKIDKSKKDNSGFWVIFIEVSNFGYINELFGHSVGDEFLKAITFEIKKFLPRDWTFCRFGGDEFVVLTSNIQRTSVAMVVENLIERFSRPWNVMGKWLYANINVGISGYPQDGEFADTLLKNAEIALTEAKKHGRDYGKSQYEFYKISMEEEILRRVEIESEISRGILERQFFLVYQPKVSYDGRTVVGFESLLRWNSQKGILTPDKFIQIAEESGLVYDLNRLVLDIVCKDIKYIKQKTSKTIPVAVNLSGKEFAMYNMIGVLNERLKTHNLLPEDIEIEVTERAILNNVELTKQIFNSLHEKGIKISIDDFGTGYSSFELLLQLPIYALKIDKKFIDKIQLFGNEYVIVKNIIYMAKEMNLKTVAEGVENKEQYEILRELGCDQFQGYYFSKPVNIEEVVVYNNDN